MKFLLIAILLNILSYALTWFQLNGQFIWQWFAKHPFILAFGLGGFISYIAIHVNKIYTEYFNGEIWPSRFLTFSISMLVFAFLTYIIKGEGINLKTLTSLCLAFTIIIIQFLWK